ncbi:hypothetical protein HDU99_003560, partial [Rhizoclosmatium hyalinum]
MQNAKTIGIIEPLTGPMNRISWEMALKGVLARHSLIHCVDTRYICNNNPGANQRLNAANAANAQNEDPNQIHHAFTDNGDIYSLVNAVTNDNSSFPGNLRENMAARWSHLLSQPVLTLFLRNCLQELTQSTTNKPRLLLRTSPKMEATETISEYMDRFRKMIRLIMANPNVVAFATLDTFVKQHTAITNGLVTHFANQKGRISDDATVTNMDQLQTLHENVEVELNYKPITAIANLDISSSQTNNTRPPYGWNSNPNNRYNPLAKAKKPVPREYTCPICNGKGTHWGWHCKKDPRYNVFVSKDKRNRQNQQREKGSKHQYNNPQANMNADGNGNLICQVIAALNSAASAASNHTLSNELRQALNNAQNANNKSEQ